MTTLKPITYGDSLALKFLAGRALGLTNSQVADAKRQLSGEALHPIHCKALEDEVGRIHDMVRKDSALMARANLLVERFAIEYGFKSAATLSKEAYLMMQAEVEQLQIASARGQELPDHDARLATLDRIMEASPWMMHPDHGCIEKSAVPA